MKPSANGRSSSLIIQGLDSSMHALGHYSRLAGSTKKGTEAVPKLALAARRAVLVNAEREADKLATCWRRAERTSLAGEAWVGSSAELRGNWRSAGLASLASCLGRTRSGRREWRGTSLRGSMTSARSPRLSSKCHVRGNQQEALAISLLWWPPLEGEEDPTR